MKKLILFLSSIFIFLPGIQGQILFPNIPDVSGGLITGFEFDSLTNKLYIAGNFTQVGTTPKTGFAVIDITTGTVLPDFGNLTIDASGLPPLSYVKAKMKLHKNKLYVGGAFTALFNPVDSAGYLFVLDLATNDTAVLFHSAISDFKIYNDKIYVTGAYQYGAASDYLVSELDTSGNVLWQKSISTNPGDELHCLDVANNKLFVGGAFSTFGGLSRRNIAKVDLSTHTITGWGLSPAPGNSLTPNCYSVNNILAYPNNIILNLDQMGCAAPNYNVACYDPVSGAQSNIYLPYQANFKTVIPEKDTSFWYFDNTGLRVHGLINYVSAWFPNFNTGTISPYLKKGRYLFIGGSFSSLEGIPHQGLGYYCMAPYQPPSLVSTSVVCRRRTNVVYTISPDPLDSVYTWNYTGNGVTINGGGPSVSLDFSDLATSGTLDVFATNSCVLNGPTLSIPITVNPLPPTNAGPDINFTCLHTVDTLNGFPNNMALNTISWTGPSYSSATPFNQVFNTVTGGDYILKVTINTTGCTKSDTLKIIFDTLRPATNPLSGNYSLTCLANSVNLDASANYPANDTLHWTGPFSFSQNNPVNVTNTGTYILNITSGANGCKNKDSVSVTSNYVPPNISVPITTDTITCFKDSIQLHAVSSNTNAVLFWNGSLLNNSFVDSLGSYSAQALDTSNGCSSAQIYLTVWQYTTPPAVNITPGIYQFNCTGNIVVLNGSSGTPGATVQWTGPSGFSSTNPATISQQGIYFLTATNPQNGCTKKDSISVTQQNALAITISPNTNICNGSSTIISASPVGGTPGFSYLWTNSAGSTPSVSVSPVDTTSYIVTITDSAGCVGKDTVTIYVPDAFTDSISTFIPCDPNHPSGQIQVFPKGGIWPYTYSVNNSMYQNSGVFPNLNFGTYTVSVRDGWGCSFKSTTAIDSTSILPSPDFILSTSQTKTDTFVIVDISNPRPDSVSWVLPTTCQIINSNSYAPEIINSDTGAVQITMLAWFGPCQMSLTKNIHVTKFDTSIANNYNGNGIKSITLYPNPNTGHFTVDVSFYKAQTFAIFIFDAVGNELQRLSYTNLDFISAPVNIANPVPGTYLLKVIAEYDSATKTFLITP